MHIRHLPILLAIIALAVLLAAPARGQEIDLAANAALQYWKAFAVMPELTEEEDDAVREAIKSGEISDELQPIIWRSGTALTEMHRGAALSQCEWGVLLAAEEDGPNTLLPHLSKARVLSRFACLRAESSFQQDEIEDAIADIDATLSLARHMGQDGVLICLLIDYVIERQTIETAAAHLPELSDEELQMLVDVLDSLPAAVTASESVLSENRFFASWFIRVLSQPDGKGQMFDLYGASEDAEEFRQYSREELLEASRQMPALYDRLAEIVALPPDEVKDAEATIMDDLNLSPAAQKMTSGLIPAITPIRSTEAAHQTRLALFRAAIAVQRAGPEVLERDEHADPYGAGPFTYEETESCFVLKSSFVDQNDNSVELAVGRP